jgi:hypothetical protein
MFPMTASRLPLLLVLLVAAAIGGNDSPFAPGNLATVSGDYADPDSFFPAEDCGECHVDQYAQWKGSMHSRAHHDAIYLAFANLAREEGGDELYRFCSSCHAPGAVVTGEIPGKPGQEHTYLTDEGVTCDVCHSVKDYRKIHHGGGANASILLDESEARYGPRKDAGENPVHESVYSELHTKSEFCSNCHTLIHPADGLVIENTYQEWKESPYAKAGIHCQDCHMRSAEEAAEVARTMKPVKVPGRTVEGADLREDVHTHYFVGANSNAKVVGASENHGAMARRRLQSAATVALELPEQAPVGGQLEFVVAVTNVGAGHCIPTSITELRQVWLDVSVTDAAGRVLYRSGAVAENGQVDPAAVMYNAVLADKEGKVTYLPWRAHTMIREKLIGPKETKRETYAASVPQDAKGPLTVRAVLRYRSAPQEVLDELFGKGTFPLEIVDMAKCETPLELAGIR